MNSEKTERHNFLMSEESRKRPLAVTLLGYLMILGAVLPYEPVIQMFHGVPPSITFLGLASPAPLPAIEYILLRLLSLYSGIGLLRLWETGRLVCMGRILWDLLSFINSLIITGAPGLGGVTSRQVFSGEAEPGGIAAWIVTLIGGIIILLAVVVYLHRVRVHFNNKSRLPESDNDLQ